jgi:hypothetical protein
MDRRSWLGAAGAAAVSGVALTTLSGCEKPSPDSIRKMLELTGQNGAYYGLKQWAKKDEASAKECAEALSTNITGTLIPYLDGGNLPSSEEVQAMLNSSLFKNVNPAVKDAIVAVSVALDAVLPIPKADSYLSKDEVSYIKAFLKGLADGCSRFLGSREMPKTRWLK